VCSAHKNLLHSITQTLFVCLRARNLKFLVRNFLHPLILSLSRIRPKCDISIVLLTFANLNCFRRKYFCEIPELDTRGLELFYFWFQTFAVFWILYVFFWVFTRRLIVVCRVSEHSICSIFVGWIWSTSYPAYEDAETSAYKQSDAGEIPKRIHTRLRHEIVFKFTTPS
jgi:hypothetical protein